MISDKLAHISISPIKEIELRAEKLANVISLAQGVPSFNTPQSIKNRVKEALEYHWTSKYSLISGLPVLRESITEKLRNQNIFIDFEEDIIITVGAIEAIAATLLTILNPDDEVIIVSPTYASYPEVIKVAGGKPIFVSLHEKDGWILNVNAIKKALTKNTKAVLLCNPNNPTGTIYDKQQLLSLADILKERKIIVLIDEVYRDFIYDKKIKYFSLAEIPELKKYVVRIFSFSKLYAMTGWRIGYLHSEKSLIKQILKVHDSLVTCAPVVSQIAALAALSMSQHELNSYLKEYMNRRELIIQRLDGLEKIFSYHMPQATYFVFPKILLTHISSRDLALDILEKARVATVPGNAFGPTGEQHLRFMFGNTPDKINTAFDRLEKYFKKYEKII